MRENNFNLYKCLIINRKGIFKFNDVRCYGFKHLKDMILIYFKELSSNKKEKIPFIRYYGSFNVYFNEKEIILFEEEEYKSIYNKISFNLFQISIFYKIIRDIECII